MSEIVSPPHIDQISFDAETQAEKIDVNPVDLNENGERYAVTGGLSSQLPENAWKIVRTDAFKGWYGDWEHIPVDQFRTAKGSIYAYDETGSTTRYKTATGEQQETQDVTVFADMSLEDQQDYLEVINAGNAERPDGQKFSVRLVEKRESGTGQVITRKEDIRDPDRLAIVILNGREPNGSFRPDNVVQAKRVSLQPAVGLHPFDTRKYKDGGQTMRELHLGNRITGVQYAESDVSKTLAGGEPRLFTHPTDPEKMCFIRSVNPLTLDRDTFDQWASGFEESDNRRGEMMESLSETGHDGVFVDGEPVIDAESGLPLFEDEQILPIAA